MGGVHRPIIPLLVYLPLIKVMMTFTEGFWSRSSPALITHPYQALFAPAVPFAVLAMAFIALGNAFIKGSDHTPKWPVPEIVAAAGFTLLPLIAFGLAHFTVGVLVPRYVLAAVIEPAVLIAFLSHQRRPVTAIALLCAFGASWALTSPYQYYGALRQAPNTYSILSEVPPSPLPIVVSDPYDFLQSNYYAAEDAKARIVYVTDSLIARTHQGEDTNSRILVTMQRWAPVRVEDYSSFLGLHTQFWLYHALPRSEWLLRALYESGADVKLHRRAGRDMVFLITSPQPGTPGQQAAY